MLIITACLSTLTMSALPTCCMTCRRPIAGDEICYLTMDIKAAGPMHTNPPYRLPFCEPHFAHDDNCMDKWLTQTIPYEVHKEQHDSQPGQTKEYEVDSRCAQWHLTPVVPEQKQWPVVEDAWKSDR